MRTPTKKYLYLATGAGLGDLVLTTPIYKELKQQFPRLKIVIFCYTRLEKQILEKNPYIYKLFKLNKANYFVLSMLIWAGIIKIHYLDIGPLWPSLVSYEKTAAEIAADLFGIKLPSKEPQIYLSKEEDLKAIQVLKAYPRPVIINITTECTKNKMWLLENWCELIRKNTQYTFIQLGLATEEKIEGAIDYRGKTNIRESMALVKHADGFVGVDSFLAHTTSAFGTNGVVLWGPSTPRVFGHNNNINISKDYYCSPCIEISLLDCPFNKPCMSAITVEEVSEALHKQMKKT